MAIYVSTSCLAGTRNLFDVLETYARAGLRNVELGASHECIDDSLVIKLRRYDVNYVIHNYFPPPPDPFILNLASNDRSIRQLSLELVSRALALTKCLHAPFYSLHAGFAIDPILVDNNKFSFPARSPSPGEIESAMERFITALGIALDHAQCYGVQLLVENNVCSPELRGKLLLQTPDEFLELFRALPQPHLGILLDTGHLNVTAQTLGLDKREYVDRVAPLIRAFHVHDNDGKTDTHQPVQPGSWVLDVLRQREFCEVPIIIEARFNAVADLCRHVDWLKGTLGREN